MRKRQSSLSLHTIIDALNNGALARGETLARQFLGKQPRNADALHLCGTACLMQDKAVQARELFNRALSLRQSATFYLNLALAERALGDCDAAEESYRKCLRLQPNNAQAANNLANILDRQGLIIEAEMLYREAIKANPKYFVAYENLISLLIKKGKSDAAISTILQALTLKPGAVDLQLTIAKLLKEKERYKESAKWYAQARYLGHLQLTLRTIGDWTEIESIDADLIQQLQDPVRVTAPPWSLINLPNLSPDLHCKAARRYAESRWESELTAPPLANGIVPSELLRIGYLSCDFHAHATMYLLMGVLEAHDRTKIDIQLFDYGEVRDDNFTRRIAASGLPRHELHELSDSEAAQLIANQRLNILVDLKGYTTGARLGITARRPAPVIINWLGYPGSLGHPRLADYIIGDPIVSPIENAGKFSETLALMPRCYQPNDSARALPPPPSRTECGLPENEVVFCSFNQLLKLNPSEFDLWCRLLKEVPSSVLWIIDPDIAEARSNLRRELQTRGIADSRLIFAPRLTSDAHLARLQLADLALDSFPYTSHTTASDALWVGVPIVTRMGDSFASRVAASLIKAHGFCSLVTNNKEDYYDRLKELALDKTMRERLRERMRAARLTSPLFNSAKFARDLESLYSAIWEHHFSADNERAPIVTIEDNYRHPSTIA